MNQNRLAQKIGKVKAQDFFDRFRTGTLVTTSKFSPTPLGRITRCHPHLGKVSVRRFMDGHRRVYPVFSIIIL
ncbi:hypothetical protein V2H45_05850 [Tumidithrix elongata RA019]|uniref:Uncharacterized protein n=1 Tax=Tumidithrix elongata BACA0141 TaxID=2716417 RepID=A0AAW9PXD1_9CYAN|nr:hypothetical protein [Tumidithrix elongata RA019]